MIEQIPRRIWVASPARSRVIETAIGVYEIHRLAPELFAGFSGSVERGCMAEPEKALFDAVYVRSAAGSRAYFPELSLPPGFDPARACGWVERIASPRLRTLVSRRLHEAL